MINGLFLHELIHLLPVIPISLFVYWRFRSLKPVLAVFLATYLIDLDHLFDYWHFIGRVDFWQYFLDFDFWEKSQKAYVLAHSWELAGILGVWGWLRHRPMILAIALAIAGHLLVDQISYDFQPMSYFLIFRVVSNFSLDWFNGT